MKMAHHGYRFFVTSVVCSALLTFVTITPEASGISSARDLPSHLFKSRSQKNLVETARDHQWSLQFVKNRPDTINIVAIRIEFAKDTATQTTGNGLFGIRGGGDKEEEKYYKADTVYKYDDLPHDSLYFVQQLAAVRKYYDKVSRGKLSLQFSVYPPGNGQTGYSVPLTMPEYSPGGKKSKESWDEYYERKTIGLMLFVRDAIKAADTAKLNNPFSGLRYEASDKTIRDSLNRKTVFLIFHAGSSYLTDGGEQGSLGQNTPSDMIDIFVSPEILKYYRDTLKLSGSGITVTGRNGQQLLIDELMMCSETSNQDGLNWGIQGILVNQVARQLGIPDLYSTSNGISGIGSFCIMDFAGYSAGNGFIPPYPSAWVRAFMGWDRVYAAPFGVEGSYNVKALTSVIDRDTSGNYQDNGDTTILLIPINDHEYYLVENRQRNLAGNRELFRYDTLDTDKPDSVVIMSYPYVANVDKNVLATSGKNRSNVIQRIRNNDIGIPASGLLVWHVDERIIANRLAYNAVNADSLYRGVALVEADGITDLGIMFQDIFYQAAFDYGGAEDVFPHRTRFDEKDSTISINGFGPFTRPSSRANDGGHTYLDLKFSPSVASPRTELTALGKNDGTHVVTNFSDSLFSVSVAWNYLARSWPRRAAPGRYFDPVFAEVCKASPGSELFLLEQSGRAYLWPADTAQPNRFAPFSAAFDRIGLRGDTLRDVDTIKYFDSIPGACAMPSVIAGSIAVPSADGFIRWYTDNPDATAPGSSTTRLGAAASTYVCNYRDSSWAVGCVNGSVVFGSLRDTVRSVKLGSDKPVCALAALRENGSMIAAIQTDGTLSLVNELASGADSSTKLPDVAIGPFSLLTGDLDNDSLSEIVVTDSRHGMWVYKQTLNLAPGWEKEPSDWPAYYRPDSTTDRSKFPVNPAPAALADLDRDGWLDIIIGGTNGLYAFNYKGAMKSHWPAFLDTRFTHWYSRGSVVSSPAVVTGADRRPLILFSSLTGENLTYRYTKITSADPQRGVVRFLAEDGTPDSITQGLTAGLIDTLLTIGDSIVGPYVIPGGMLDAVNADAKRPRGVSSSSPLQSNWPLTTGAPLVTSPLIGFMDNNNTPDVVAVSSDGWVYRWELAKSILPDSLFWPQTGYSAGRTFAFGGKALPRLTVETDPISFFSFPNPTRGESSVTFKYRFSAPATNVRLDIFSYTGYKVYSHSAMGNPPGDLTGSYPDWNIHAVSLKKFGPGVYRCRLEATVAGKKQQRYWKMAVVK